MWQGCFFCQYYFATSTTNRVQIFTGLLFCACVEIHQVRRLVFDDYHKKCPVSWRWSLCCRFQWCTVNLFFISGYTSITDWMSFDYYSKKTKLLSLSRSKDGTFPSICMGSSTLPEVSHLRLLGLDISSNTGWEVYISGIAKSASMRVGCLYRA